MRGPAQTGSLTTIQWFELSWSACFVGIKSTGQASLAFSTAVQGYGHTSSLCAVLALVSAGEVGGSRQASGTPERPYP